VTIVKRLGLLIVLTLTLATAFWLAPAPAAAAPPPGCPIYRACMDFIDGGCSCAGFYCNGRFICGVPIS
jgi:hypothetical protein